MARNLDGLVRGGPLSHFYKFVKIEKLPKAKAELFSSCDIVRRENLVAPLHTCDLNYRIPERYYTVSPLVPNESNDYLTDFKFHDLRKTFGLVLAQNGVSTAVIQRLLKHSSPDLTNKVYTNVDPVLRHAIDTMPAGDWLRIRIVGKRGKNVQ